MPVTVNDVLNSVRAQIPDPSAQAFTDATLIKWISDAGQVMAARAPIIQDWWALQSIQGQMTYALPTTIVTVEQLWYDLEPCVRASEIDDLFSSKFTARSFFFGPHSIGATPYLHVFPACDRTGQTTTVGVQQAAADSTLTVAATTTFQAYGFLTIESELEKYETVTSTTVFSNVLRGMSGTTAAIHAIGKTVTENNLFFKVSRLPNTVTLTTDPIEVPLGLVPLLELYVLAKVRQNEQEHQASLAMSKAFDEQMDRIAQSYSPRGVRQGLQVRLEPPGPVLYFGRVIVP